MKFNIIHAEGLKMQFVTDNNVQDLIEECNLSGHVVARNEPIEHAPVIDLPGAISANRSYQTFSIDGRDLQFPTTDVMHFYHKLLSGSTGRIVPSGKALYKLHGWMGVVVLDEYQRQQLLAQIEANMEEIERIGSEESDLFNRAMVELNARGITVGPTKAKPQMLSGLPNGELN